MGELRPDPGPDGLLFDRLYPSLRRFAGAIRPPGVDADDLVQEALARTLAARSLQSLDDPLAYLRTAIVRIASNERRGARRRAARHARAGVPDDAALDAYPSDLGDLARVEPRTRAVLFLTILEDQSYRDAAATVGCSEEAARAMASRALRGLRAAVTTDELSGGTP